jgi:DNA invertase Pin-like site-specific DNA recombinase
MNRHILRNISSAITYSRILENDKINIKSLDIQERCIKKWLETKNIEIFKNIKEIDYNNVQISLKNNLENSSDKTLVVFNPNRLSSSISNFIDIYKICEKNRHNIGIVNIDKIFDYRIKENYHILIKLILEDNF